MLQILGMEYLIKFWDKIKNKQINTDGRLCGVSLFLLFSLCFVVKIFVVYLSYKNLDPLKYCIAYIIGDIYIFIIFTFLLTIIFGVKNGIIRFICNISLFFLLVLYCIDIFTIHYFLTRESVFALFEVVKYGGNGFSNIVLFWVILRIILWGLFFFGVEYKNYYKKFSTLFSPKLFMLYYIIGIIIYSFQSLKANNPIPNIKNILFMNIDTIKELSDDDIFFTTDVMYEDYIYSDVGENKNLNVIIVFGESLSAIDSARIGGNDNMPYLDKIQKDGITFTNFIANGSSSIYAHLSTFLGVPPIKGSDYPYISEPLPEYLNNLGYNTVYISTANLDFLNERELLKNYGFKKIIGEETFKNNKKYTFDAAPDGDLYTKALEEVKVQTGKYFMSLPSISFHRPYNTPYGNSEQEALRYADEMLYGFYNSLKEFGFFNSGILIIVGDHRKREPAESNEFKIFGPSWEYKSIASIVGSGVNTGQTNNNIIQHSDLYFSIKKLLGSGYVKLDKTYNNIFYSSTGRNRGIIKDSFVFPKGNIYELGGLHALKQNNKEAYGYYLSLKSFQLRDNIISKNL